MASSKVRNIDSLEVFHGHLTQLSDRWDTSVQEVRALIHRARSHFDRDLPAYWRHQLQLAERALTESQDNLSRNQSATRSADRPAATEAVGRVRSAQQRVRTCQSKLQIAKSTSIEISLACDAILGPLAEMTEHCEVVLPEAARQLRTLIEQLRLYADQNRSPPP